MLTGRSSHTSNSCNEATALMESARALWRRDGDHFRHDRPSVRTWGWTECKPMDSKAGSARSYLGVDLSEAQIEKARLLATHQGLHNAQFAVADGRDTRQKSDSFDAVFCKCPSSFK